MQPCRDVCALGVHADGLLDVKVRPQGASAKAECTYPASVLCNKDTRRVPSVDVNNAAPHVTVPWPSFNSSLFSCDSTAMGHRPNSLLRLLSGLFTTTDAVPP